MVRSRFSVLFGILLTLFTLSAGCYYPDPVQELSRALQMSVDLDGAHVKVTSLPGGVLQYYLLKNEFSFTFLATTDASRKLWSVCKDGAQVTLDVREDFDESWRAGDYLVPTCTSVM
jgi:hypothetical protein